MIGQKLGSYEVAGKLGEGGMGEVWRARDTRLGRFVALKVLPPDLAHDPGRRQRFEAEARALGTLNHPNIVAVYDVGEAYGQAYIVSELVDGESLRALISRGPAPARKLTDIAAQIAEGLAAAHALGIIHRDLKPENIMLTREGRVKILDFGLAKQILKQAGQGTETQTATAALSQPGTVLGTVGYMSPEQVRGETVDARSDIFSFGCVLYELACGGRAFRGSSAVEIMSAILKEEPAPADTGSLALAPALDTVMRRCLEKQPEQRFQSAADLAFALRSISNLSSSQIASMAARTPARAKWLWPAAAALAAVVLIAAGYFLRGRTAAGPPAFQRLTFRQGYVSNARFAPDGQNVIYSASWDSGPVRTYLLTPGNPEARDLAMSDGARLLAVSAKNDLALLVAPFGESGAGTLAWNSISGGQSRKLLENVFAVDWAQDSASMAVVRRVNSHWRAEFPLDHVLYESEFTPLGLRISPGGGKVAFCSYTQGSRIGVLVADRGGRAKEVGVVSGQMTTALGASLAWAPSGNEIWFRSFDSKDLGTIYAITLDGKQRVIVHLPGHVRLLDLSRDGKALVSVDVVHTGILGLPPGESVERDLSILDVSDLKDISQDGRMIVGNVRGESGGPNGSIYLRSTDGTPAVRAGDGSAFALSPDGKWTTGYTSSDAATRKFVLMPTGPGEEQQLAIPELAGGGGLIVGWLSGDQRYLVMGNLPNQSGWRLFAWDAAHKQLRPVSPPGIHDMLPLVSPDGSRFITLGPDHVWCVYPIDASKPQPITGLSHGEGPINWRSDGHSILAAAVPDSTNTFHVFTLDLGTGRRTPWKDIRPMRPVDDVANLHITPDGRAYAYNFTQANSDLYLVQGLK